MSNWILVLSNPFITVNLNIFRDERPFNAFGLGVWRLSTLSDFISSIMTDYFLSLRIAPTTPVIRLLSVIKVSATH